MFVDPPVELARVKRRHAERIELRFELFDLELRRDPSMDESCYVSHFAGCEHSIVPAAAHAQVSPRDIMITFF